MNNQNAIHACVRLVAESVLECHGIPEEDLPDSLADVTVRMIEAIENGADVPRTVGGWQKLAARTAARYAREEHGRPPVGLARHVDFGADEDGDDDGDDEGEPLDDLVHAMLDAPATPARTRSQIAVLLGMLEHGEMPPLGREILAALGDGKKVPAIARALGITPDDVRARLRRMRFRFFRRLAAVEEVTTSALDEAEEEVSELEGQDEER
jgi:hypothetical protein